MKSYTETDKPTSLQEATEDLYYMYANGWDYKDKQPRFKKINTEIELEVAYKVYVKMES